MQLGLLPVFIKQALPESIEQVFLAEGKPTIVLFICFILSFWACFFGLALALPKPEPAQTYGNLFKHIVSYTSIVSIVFFIDFVEEFTASYTIIEGFGNIYIPVVNLINNIFHSCIDPMHLIKLLFAHNYYVLLFLYLLGLIWVIYKSHNNWCYLPSYIAGIIIIGCILQVTAFSIILIGIFPLTIMLFAIIMIYILFEVIGI